MNAILFLTKEHDQFKKVFKEIDNDSHRYATKKKMFTELCQTLERHELMEQTVWYPNLKNNKKLSKIISHLVSEEKNAAKTMHEFKNFKNQQEWQENFLKLKQDVLHHATEEEKKLFPEVEKLLSEKELESIGSAMYEFKQQYEKDLAA